MSASSHPVSVDAGWFLACRVVSCQGEQQCSKWSHEMSNFALDSGVLTCDNSSNVHRPLIQSCEADKVTFC